MPYIPTFGTVFFAQLAFGQMSGSELYLKSNFIQVGIHSCGVVGANNSPPFPGYYGKGVVVDVDTNGWTVGIPALVSDYIEQGSPVEAWSVLTDGIMGNATKKSAYSGGLSSSNISAHNYTNSSTGLWSGNLGNLKIQHRYFLISHSKLLYFQIVLSNTGTTDLLPKKCRPR